MSDTHEHPPPLNKGWEEFARVVYYMRLAQKRYFATRKKEDLIDSKRLEASVDMRLCELGHKT